MRDIDMFCGSARREAISACQQKAAEHEPETRITYGLQGPGDMAFRSRAPERPDDLVSCTLGFDGCNFYIASCKAV